MHLFLDMDGVIADFTTSAYRLHNRVGEGPPTEWDFFSPWGLTVDQFFADMGYQFWANLAPLHDGMLLASYLIDFMKYDVTIVTHPSKTHGCVDGKNAWIAQYLPQMNDRTVFTAHKELLANNGLLIDDSDTNVAKFRRAGGKAILIPRPWNERRSEVINGLFSVPDLASEVIDLATSPRPNNIRI